MVKSDQALCFGLDSTRIKHCNATSDRAGFVSPQTGEENAFEESSEPTLAWHLPIAEVFPHHARQALSGLANRSHFALLVHGTSVHMRQDCGV